MVIVILLVKCQKSIAKIVIILYLCKLFLSHRLFIKINLHWKKRFNSFADRNDNLMTISYFWAASGFSLVVGVPPCVFGKSGFAWASYGRHAKPRQKSHADTPSYRYNPCRIVLRKYSYKSSMCMTFLNRILQVTINQRLMKSVKIK